MTTYHHRKLFPEPDATQTTDSSNCGPTNPYNCDYVSIYRPPDRPNLPPSSTTHVSPYLIVIVSLVASAVLFIGYYLIIVRYCARLRQPHDGESQDFMNEDQRSEVDHHPIWYITTVGLKAEVINSITEVKFEKGGSLIDGTDCSVCLSEFEDDEWLRVLPKCNHAFHVRCIDIWLRSHTNCPLCRAAIVFNELNMISQANDRNNVIENDGELGLNHVGSEIQELKRESETVITLKRSFSMDSASEFVHTESTVELRSLNVIRDSRNRRMMRSFSDGGRSIM